MCRPVILVRPFRKGDPSLVKIKSSAAIVIVGIGILGREMAVIPGPVPAAWTSRRPPDPRYPYCVRYVPGEDIVAGTP